VLIVHRMHPGASRYYLASVGPAGQGDSPRIGEAPGWWAGTGARHRDLDGPVTGRDLRAVLPSDRGRVPGFDLTFAAPKSVSVLHALGSTGVSQAVRRAHDDAVTAGLAHLEEHACVVRVDARPVRGGGFVAAAFRHRVSRAGDPHLHTHVVVANTATAPDGRWRALYSPLLYGEACGASAAYHVTLRGGLTAALGLAWEPPVRGRADAIAVPDPVRAAFSRRRAMVLAEAGDRLAERGWAERVTRAEQEGLVDHDRLSRIWATRAGVLGWVAPECGPGRPPRTERLDDGVLPSQDRWTRGDLMVAVADRWRDGASFAELHAETGRLLVSAQVLPLGRSPATAERFTTVEAQARRSSVDVAWGDRRMSLDPEALDALRRALATEGGRLLLVVSDVAAADRAAARTGARAVASRDAPAAVAALDGRDAVVVCRPDRLPSRDVAAVLAVAETRAVDVSAADVAARRSRGLEPDGAARRSRGLEADAGLPLAAAVHRGAPAAEHGVACISVAVPGGDVTAATTARGAADTAVGDWVARRRAGGDAVLVADTVEVDAITARARAALRDAGLLGAAEVAGYAAGDAVRFTHARRRSGIARHSHGEVVAVEAGRGLDIRMSDGRCVVLRPSDLAGVTHAHVIPPLPALLAGRGDVFVVGARTFGSRHLEDNQLHRYVTVDCVALASRGWSALGERGWADEAARWEAPRVPEHHFVGPARTRSLPLAERALARDLGRSR